MIETKFKQTEIGLIPEDWEEIAIRELGPISKGKGISRSECGTGTIPCVRYGEIYTDHDNYIKEFKSFISDKVARNSRRLQYGELLCTASGETKAEIGKCVSFVNHYEAYVGGDVIIVTPDIGKYDPYFLGYLMNDIYVMRQKALRGQGDAIVHITGASLSSVKLAIPNSLSEQQRIASALTSVDNLLSSLDKLIAKKRDIKQGAMQQLLTGKTRLKGFTAPWVKYKIDDLFDIGNGYTPSKANPAFWNNGTIPWFRMEDIRTNGRILRDSIQHVTPAAVKSSGLFPAFSIILSTTATIGEHALLITDSLANQRFSFLIKKLNRCSDIDIWYFFYHCFILGDWCRANINDGGLMAVNINDLKNYIFEVPSTLKEQQAIASVLSSMDNEIAALEAKRKKYEAVKQGMMQQLLTGKIRLV